MEKCGFFLLSIYSFTHYHIKLAILEQLKFVGSMAKTEIKIAYRVLAITGTIIVLVVIAGYIFLRFNSPYFFVFSDEVEEIELKIDREELQGLNFYGGVSGCENLLLDENSMRFWVTDLTGNLTAFGTNNGGDMEIKRQIKLGEMCTGITMGPDSLLLVAVSEVSSDEWMDKGGRIISIDTLFTARNNITSEFPSLNGISMSSEWEILLLTTSNFNPFNPAGSIYMTGRVEGEWEKPSIAVPDFGLANGIWYDRYLDRFLFSNTVEGVFVLEKSDLEPQPVYYKTSFLEITDDLCGDPDGNIWMTDPGNSTLKVLLAGSDKLVRFSIKGIGQTSSCRIRMEEGNPVIYFTELKQKHNLRSQVFDGRGVFSVPVYDLLNRVPVK